MAFEATWTTTWDRPRLRQEGPFLIEVRSLGGFEGQVTWGAGLSRPGCANVTATGSTLTFHFIPSP